MNKEYLEAFESIMKIYGNTNSLEGTYNYFLIIKKALQRLESIDNANPSEALECLDNLENSLSLANELLKVTDTSAMDKYITTIKQALLKAQEPKQYLKWEDILKLEIKTSMKDIDYTYIEVKLNGMPIHLFIDKNRITGRVYVSGIGKDKMGTTLFNACSDSPKSIEFFNALHLEEVEE